MSYKFIKNKRYYSGVVYEWNLPTGTTCPFALECKVTVDRVTGKFANKSKAYRCYAAAAERFPAVRAHRWGNFEYVKNGNVPVLPDDCNALRIHASGDFFNQDYFDMWLLIASKYPNVEMWAFTKSLNYWVARLGSIPDNLTLTASRGGATDYLIDAHGLKYCTVYRSPQDVPEGMPIDNNDDWARRKDINFALLDNTLNSKKEKVQA